MATLMKQLMDEFYALHEQAEREQNHKASHIYALGESMANNCHQKSPREIVDYLRATLTPVETIPNSEDELFAYEVMQDVVDIYEKRLAEAGRL